MLMTMKSETEVVEITLDDICDIGLLNKHFISSMTTEWPARGITHQIKDSLRMVFILSTLGEKEQSLARLLSVCCVRMSNVLGLLIAKVCGEVLVLQRGITEPKVFL